MKRKNPEGNIDPTLQCAPITIRDKTYNLCFNFRAISVAEKRLRDEGYDVYLLAHMAPITFDTVPKVLAAALRTHHPAISVAEVESLVDYDTVWQIQHELGNAWVDAFPAAKEEDANPPEPVQS